MSAKRGRRSSVCPLVSAILTPDAWQTRGGDARVTRVRYRSAVADKMTGVNPYEHNSVVSSWTTATRSLATPAYFLIAEGVRVLLPWR